MLNKIYGVNLGNWLVLEKWMDVRLFEGTTADDEVWLARELAEADPAAYAAKLKAHRDTQITEADFKTIAAHGANLVRLPVPFFVFGDREPFVGCIEYVDRAMQWAENAGLQVLIELHTVPGSQNGYDNGGLTGVCKWHTQPDEVEFALSVLERLAERYGEHPALYGIGVLNEPISLMVWVSSPSFGKARDKDEAKGSSYVPMSFLKKFYVDAYARIRRHLPEEKAIVFHDGFRLGAWKGFFNEQGMKNVVLDTHIYIFSMEFFVPFPWPWVYKLYVNSQKRAIEKAARHVPVIVGEWCISCNYGSKAPDELRQQRFREVADLCLDAWSTSAGYVYWNYRLWQGANGEAMDEYWKESWDLTRCWDRGWMPQRLDAEPDKRWE